nr:hypothetical protein [Tanacetum cinerariifolium]
MPNPPPLTPFVPPIRTYWDMLFQPLFHELLTPPPSVDHPAPEVIALIAEVVASDPAASIGSPSITTVDQDTPSPNINSVTDTQPMAEVQLSAEHNILANEQYDFEQSESVYDTYLLEKRICSCKTLSCECTGSSRNSQKESYGSNDMAQNYYLEEAKKKTQDKNRNLKPREMPPAKTHHTPKACTPKPRSNNQTSRNYPASKSCEETLKEVNSRAKIQPNKTRNSNKPIDPTSHTQKPGRKIVTGHSFSPNKSSVVHEKTNTPRSFLRIDSLRDSMCWISVSWNC